MDSFADTVDNLPSFFKILLESDPYEVRQNASFRHSFPVWRPPCFFRTCDLLNTGISHCQVIHFAVVFFTHSGDFWRFFWTTRSSKIDQWIGLRENLPETIDFPIKYGAVLKIFPRSIWWRGQPIQRNKVWLLSLGGDYWPVFFFWRLGGNSFKQPPYCALSSDLEITNSQKSHSKSLPKSWFPQNLFRVSPLKLPNLDEFEVLVSPF